MALYLQLYREIPILTDGEYDPYTTWKTVLGCKPVDPDDIAHKLLYGLYYRHKIHAYIKFDEICNIVSNIVNNSYILSSIFICMCDYISQAIYRLDVYNDLDYCMGMINECNEVLNMLLRPNCEDIYSIVVKFDPDTRILRLYLTDGYCEWEEYWGEMAWI